MRSVTVRLPGLSLQSPTGTPSRTTDPPESPALQVQKLLGAVQRESSLVRNAVIFAVDMKTMQVGITPTHGNLNRVMKVGYAVVTPQEQSPPDHWANATQNHLELVNA